MCQTGGDNLHVSRITVQSRGRIGVADRVHADRASHQPAPHPVEQMSERGVAQRIAIEVNPQGCAAGPTFQKNGSIAVEVGLQVRSEYLRNGESTTSPFLSVCSN